MWSKTPFFSGTVFRKNLTRFAPVWGLYTLGLVMGLMILCAMDARGDGYWLANDVIRLIQYGGIVNMVYALVVAMLLFGDLYDTRMCNALHALPLRRETWFFTHVVSGLVFSLFPTAVMAAVSMPLLMTTCVEDAWHIGLLWFLATNLEFLCFFGMAVFCAFFTGTRLPMAILYAAANGAPYVVYIIVDSLYTPMLYGIITPTKWINQLMPLRYTYQTKFLLLDDYATQSQLARDTHTPITASFQLNAEAWIYLVIWAVIGLGLLLLALILYRRRRLECVGETMVIRRLDPVFQMGLATACAFFAYEALAYFTRLGFYDIGPLAYFVMFCGLALGWFGTKMLICHTPWVFQPQSFLDLLGLTAILAVSLVMTKFDVLQLDDRIPDAAEVAQVRISQYPNGSYYKDYELLLTQPEDIDNIRLLQEQILEDRVDSSGSWPIVDGEVLRHQALEEYLDAHSGPYRLPCRNADVLYLEYTLADGSVLRRQYFYWADSEAGDLAREYLSRWELVLPASLLEQLNPSRVASLETRFSVVSDPPAALVDSLLEAIAADCAERTIAQTYLLHQGYFTCLTDAGAETVLETNPSVGVSLYCDTFTLYISVYPDSAHTLKWLQNHGMLDGCEVHDDSLWISGLYYTDDA